MKDALLNDDYNVILVDWSEEAKNILSFDLLQGYLLGYLLAYGNTRLVGAQVAELIEFIITTFKDSTSDSESDLAKKFYIVGFSLGAQAAGYAGSYLKANKGKTLGRITG